ncbi:hypothetical protein P608_03595 [Comamonas thiooxydans]|uniref:Uncharacterized protein n=1 Tax=Comamonas thiooxydans TaxID=363952 RepID=A0A0E3CHR8_9BURK|nr:hypothetical protein P607_26250 [Comamonas thiooxydans]KGH20014.1 hypothetical protein P608_03595 [Comamonas thiooxydans]KGH26421.1 hypothetical protein P606_04695 [Comamonas thiooxydans]
MATARAMTVLSTQAPILGKRILLRRRSADLASLCSVYGEPVVWRAALAPEPEKPWRRRCNTAAAGGCDALYSEAACA